MRSRKDGRSSAGRPARLSTEQILDTALEMLRQSGGQDFSIRQLAQRLGTVPGNLYTYFPGKEALLDALANHALESLEIAPNPVLQWDVQLAHWMEAFRAAIKSRPELMYLIGLAGTSPSALRKIQRVAALIEGAGFDGDSAVLHAQGLLWSVMSFTLFELQAGDPRVVARLKATGAHQAYSDVMTQLALEDFEPLWQATLRRNLDGLRLQAGEVVR